jgi:hypothetical protein
MRVLLRSVWERISQARANEPRLRVKVTLGFFSIAALVACAGSRPAPLLIAVLLGVALVQELPRALLARCSGRSARVSIDMLGGDTEVSGATPSPGLKFGLAIVGSLVSLALGGLYLLGASWLAHAPSASFVSEAGRLHVLWGAAHLLPFAPFKLGMLVASHCSGWARAKHALTSLLFALTLSCSVLGKLGSPLVFVALLLLIWACCRNVLESLAAARDDALEVDQQLDKIEALTLEGETRRAVVLGQHLREVVRSAPLKARLGRALAWAAIGDGDGAIAVEALVKLPPAAVDLYLLCSALGAGNRAAEAIALLEAARAKGIQGSETTKLLVDLYYRERRFEDVASLAATAGSFLSATELAQIEVALASAQPSSRDRQAPGVPSDLAGHVLLPDAR